MKIPVPIRRSFLQALLVWSAVAAAGWVQAAEPDLAAFDARFAELLADDGVPGGAYVVVAGDAIIQAAGHGLREKHRPDPVTPETVFRLASVSKTFAAQLAALMVAEGALAWDEPIVARVPEFSLADPAHAEALRIEHLLGQSAGIVPNAYDNLLDASQPLERILPQFASVESLCPPGRCYTYQNVLFSLIEPAIERAVGRDYEALLQERVFEPLVMERASTGLSGYRASRNRASPHIRSSRLLPWRTTEVNANYYRVAPAAGINASALDLGQWLIAQLGHRPEVIDPEQLRWLTEPRVRTQRELRRRGWRDLLDDAHYALGWRVYRIGEHTLYLHSGWVSGFVAEVAYSRELQIGLAVLLNAETPALNAITTEFWREVLQP